MRSPRFLPAQLKIIAVIFPFRLFLTILMLKREKTSSLKCVPGSSRMEMNELERVFGVARQRIICVSLSLTVKSINNNKNTHKHLPINAGGGGGLFGQRKLLDHPSTHNFWNNVGWAILQKWHK